MNHRLSSYFFILYLLFYPLPSDAGLSEHLISGQTMGTKYHIKIVLKDKQGLSGLEAKIERRLEEINKSMSTFLKESEISRFNALEKAGEKFPISEDFFRVMTTAGTVFRLTEGAWDGTVKPLVDLWGFGASGKRTTIPEKSEIEKLHKRIGFQSIRLFENRHLAKTDPFVTLDLASIAKGYAVDSVSELIRKNGFQHFLVEIGGEVYASGNKPDGSPWRVGINRPDPLAPHDQVHKIVFLRDMALATSGDYRNFFEIGQTRYSHVLDPKTGWPVANGVISASVLAKDCTFADGLATALMVMGHEKGIELTNRLEHVESLFILKEGNGPFIERFSNGFDKTTSR